MTAPEQGGEKAPRRIQRQAVVLNSDGTELPDSWGGITFAAQYAVDLYREFYANGVWSTELVVEALAGRDLVCWCPLYQPCHADVLLELANPDCTTPPGPRP